MTNLEKLEKDFFDGLTFESFWKDCLLRGCDKCPAKVPCWAAPGDEDCRENCLAWAREESYDGH